MLGVSRCCVLTLNGEEHVLTRRAGERHAAVGAPVCDLDEGEGEHERETMSARGRVSAKVRALVLASQCENFSH